MDARVMTARSPLNSGALRVTTGPAGAGRMP